MDTIKEKATEISSQLKLLLVEIEVNNFWSRKMANVTDDGNLNHIEPEGFYPCINPLNEVQRYIISTLNVSIAATAFLGNVLIIAALQKA